MFSQNSSIHWLLLDIEGTTSSVDFVYKTLFPFASKHVEEYLREHANEPEIAGVLNELQREHAVDAAKHPALGPWSRRTLEEQIASAAQYVRHLIAADRKVTSLKTLQGRIWEEGYRSGKLKGHVYEDVPRAFKRWKNSGKRIAIFSSGSVLAQKLLFGHSIAGDLTMCIDNYFDTTTGPKREAASYVAIGKSLGVQTVDVLFVSDVEAELDAAHEARMKTVLMVREGAAGEMGLRHVKVKSFDEL